MKTKATIHSAKVFSDLMGLSNSDRCWVLQQYWHSLGRDDQSELKKEIFSEMSETGANLETALYESAKERLLEDPNMTAGEKVLLAALVLRELYEISEFHSRQITETLREASNPVNNITAAINGLIGKGEVEIVEPQRLGHKRYCLTSGGISAAIAVSGQQWKKRVEL
jgi:hypothetical protein